MLNAVLWVEIAVALIFVVARCYTRYFILRSMGWDDLFLVLTFVGVLPASDTEDND